METSKVSALIEDKMTAYRSLVIAKDGMAQAQQAAAFYALRLADIDTAIAEATQPLVA